MTKIIGIGDSNMVVNGGWPKAFKHWGVYEKTLIGIPGATSRDIVNELCARYWDDLRKSVPEGSTVLVTLGINDSLQGIGPIEFVKNHLKIKWIISENNCRDIKWIWMPGHYTGSWKMEFLRLALRIAAWWHGVKFLNLRKTHWNIRAFWKDGNDPYHLERLGYLILAHDMLPKIKAD